MLANQCTKNSINTSQKSTEKIASIVDPSWNGLYKAGGITAILYVILAISIPAVQVWTIQYDFKLGGYALLEFIAANRFWWLILQTGVIGTSFLAIVSFAALYVALIQVNKSLAAIGAIITITCELLFMAYYPVLMGMIYLSDQYIGATADQQLMLATAMESLIAINNAFNPLYESLFGIDILFFSLAMRKGVFHKSIAYIGITTCVAAFVALSLWPLLGVNYFWWWLFFFIWFTAVGWKLYQLGKE
ncbi:MAG: hypothetical protein JW908_13350 [Anaerolineales bacterium]|nr:hypothetical protein [Anaerolineales bacterium]